MHDYRKDRGIILLEKKTAIIIGRLAMRATDVHWVETRKWAGGWEKGLVRRFSADRPTSSSSSSSGNHGRAVVAVAGRSVDTTEKWKNNHNYRRMIVCIEVPLVLAK